LLTTSRILFTISSRNCQIAGSRQREAGGAALRNQRSGAALRDQREHGGRQTEGVLMELRDNPARLYALVIGATLVIAGVIGFFYESAFSDDKSVRDAVFGVLDVNGWHNVVHIVSGLAGLAMARTLAREYALGLGAVYLVLAVWGFIVGDGDSILSIIPVNTEDNVLHLLIGLTGLAAYAATRERPERAAPPRAKPA
jgi:hypothetical protein